MVPLGIENPVGIISLKTYLCLENWFKLFII